MDFETIRSGLQGAVPFNQHVGLEVVEIGDGSGAVRLPEAEHLRNHVGSQHAGALFSAAEAASGAAMVGAFATELGAVTPLVRSAEIRYLKLATGPITAHAKLDEPASRILDRLKDAGKTEFRVEVELTNGDGTRVAEMTVVWNVRRNV